MIAMPAALDAPPSRSSMRTSTAPPHPPACAAAPTPASRSTSGRFHAPTAASSPGSPRSSSTACAGGIGPRTPRRASSASTSVSEATSPARLGLRFIAVMPRSLRPRRSPDRLHGGESHRRRPGEMSPRALVPAADSAALMAHFTSPSADRWRCNNNMPVIFVQMTLEAHPRPAWSWSRRTGFTWRRRCSPSATAACRPAFASDPGLLFPAPRRPAHPHTPGAAVIEGIGGPV